MDTIDPHTIYTRTELLEILGEAAFRRIKKCGLFSVADRYLGQQVLDSMLAAHQNSASQRAATREAEKGGGSHEEKKVATSGAHGKIQPVSGSRGAARFLRAMEEAGRK